MSSSVIFTIDDDADFNMLLKTALKPYDINVVTHTTPVTFIKSIKERSPDLCILDLNLETGKGGEGFQLLKAMRNRLGQELPIFIMSRRGDREDVLLAMENGATDFIPKPLDDIYLLLKLKKFLPNNKKVQAIEADTVKVNDRDIPLTVSTEGLVSSVSIDGLEIVGESYLLKGRSFQLQGKLLEEIFGRTQMGFKVEEAWQIEDRKFGAFLTRDYNTDEFFKLRKWLFSSSFKMHLNVSDTGAEAVTTEGEPDE